MTTPVKIISRLPKDTLTIQWNPSNVCNFKCKYCYPNYNTGTHRYPYERSELVTDNLIYLMDYYKEYLGKKHFNIFMAGGEPTLVKDLEKIIEKIKKSHDIYFSIASNASRTVRWWNQYGHLIDNAHLTHHVDQGNVEHITEVSDILYPKNVKTTVKVLMDPLHWDKAISDIQYMLDNSKFSWFIQVAKVVEQENYNTNYTEEQMAYLEKDLKRIPDLKWFWKNKHLLKSHMFLWESKAILSNGKTIYARPGTYINKGWNNFQGWQCSIGSKRLCIQWNGNIMGSCGAKLFHSNSYYNILDEDFKNKFKPNLTPIICPFSSCTCSPETHEDKEKID